MGNNSFVHLHVHSEYSLLDGACRIKDIVRKAKDMGQTAIAVTDHGVMYGAVDFYRAAKEAGIKPIIGCEVYVARRTRHDRDMRFDSHPYHLILLCKNKSGYQNLTKLVSLGYTEGFYSKPRVDIELLARYSDGLICLSGCIAGEVAVKLSSDDYAGAKETVLRYERIFGSGNYYIEVQNHGIKSQTEILPKLYRLSAETGVPFAATNDAHYIEKSDAETQNILMCIQMKKTVFEPNPIKFPTEEFYLKTGDEMAELFKNVPEAVANTVVIAEKCNFEFEFGEIKLPEFTAEGVSDNVLYFRKLCTDGMHKKYGDNPSREVEERLEYELKVITEMGYVDYFLIVWDFIRYSRENDIPVGPGRGSGTGSLCAYCIGITGIDPIKYNLLFERFLNPERISMPDFDIDFCIERRMEVIDYVVSRYGADRVSQIIAFDTLKAKAAVKDTGRVLGFSAKFVNDLSSLIPRDLDITIKTALEKSSDLKKLYDTNPSAHRLIDISMKIEGMPRNDSVHAAGVVISAVPVTDLVPIKRSGSTTVTQYTMTVLEDLGLLKMDFLGLRNLTVIKHCVEQVRRYEPDFDINNIPVDDRETFEMMSDGRTMGVFQFESDGMRRVLSRLKPESIEGLTAAISLYRPGPSDSIAKYVRNKYAPEKISYKHPILESILSTTFGCIVYQEQVMEICRKAAGYSYGRADIVRRAMAKKKHSVMEKERQVFLYGDKESGCPGAVANGIDEKTANEIFDEMSGFASYGLNKSHAAAYAYLSYQTAYLKCHYMKDYMAALMTSVISAEGKLTEYAEECRKNGIKILRPDINLSSSAFTAEEEGIRYGLLAIKNVGAGVVKSISEEREKNGRYASLDDFCERTSALNLSRIMVENMIKTGCFDDMGETRREMIAEFEELMVGYGNISRNNIDGQMNLFSEVSAPPKRKKSRHREYPYSDLLEFEKLASGMYISGHPLDPYRLTRQLMKLSSSTDIRRFAANTEASLLGIVDDITVRYTSQGKKMAFISVQDTVGNISCTAFPETYAKYLAVIKCGTIIYVSGKVSKKDGFDPSLICSSVNSEEEFREIVSKKRLCVKIVSSQREDAAEIISAAKSFAGETELCFYLTDLRKFLRPKGVTGVNVCDELVERIAKKADFCNIGLID